MKLAKGDGKRNAVRSSPRAICIRSIMVAWANKKLSRIKAGDADITGSSAFGAGSRITGGGSTYLTNTRPYTLKRKDPSRRSPLRRVSSMARSTAGRNTEVVVFRCIRFSAIDHLLGSGRQRSCVSLKPSHNLIAIVFTTDSPEHKSEHPTYVFAVASLCSAFVGSLNNIQG